MSRSVKLEDDPVVAEVGDGDKPWHVSVLKAEPGI
jgi:hypothetical protein